MADTLDWNEAPKLEDQTLSYFTRGVRVLWELLTTERKRLFISTSIVVVAESMMLASLFAGTRLMDYVMGPTADIFSAYAIWLVVLMLVLSLGVIWMRRLYQEPIFLRAIITLENYWPTIAHEKLLALSTDYHQRENTGKKIAKVTKGVDKLVNMLADIHWMLLPALFLLVLNAVAIFLLDWRLALMLFLPLVPAVWINLRAYEKFQPVWEAWEKKKEEATGLMCQSTIIVRTVQSFVAETREATTHAGVRRDMAAMDLEANLKLQKYFAAMESLMRVAFIATIVVGLIFAKFHLGTFGTVVYIFATGNSTMQSLWSIIQVYTRMLRNLVAAERMQALLKEPVDVANEAPGVIPAITKGRIAFEDVSLVYGEKTPTLHDFNFAIEPGEMVALVGPSGSGKTTITELLQRARDPNAGHITIDGFDIRAIDRDWYRGRFASVRQESEITEGTIRENIVYANPLASDAMIIQAVEASCLAKDLADNEKFPQGLDTRVGERGIQLSGGERQRLCIARAYIALLSGAKILVLDEATSSLDSESERVIQQFIEKLRHEREITIVAIAHRLSTIRSADRICVLDAGHIVETGSHAELLRENGLYHRLVSLQDMGELRD